MIISPCKSKNKTCRNKGGEKRIYFSQKIFFTYCKVSVTDAPDALLHTHHSFFLTDSLKSYGVIVQPPQTNTDAHTPDTCSWFLTLTLLMVLKSKATIEEFISGMLNSFDSSL